MITEHNLKGDWVKATVNGNGALTDLTIGDGIKLPMPQKEAASTLRKVQEELETVLAYVSGKEAPTGLVERAKEPPSFPIYDDVRALTSHHAREIAYRRFYADEKNREFVLVITGCEAVTRNGDGENVYKVSGFTKPRQKAVRGALLPRAEDSEREIAEIPKV
jgi:hypothetical protein